MKKHKGTVFVVDDDPSVRKGVDRLLRSAGYGVQTFEAADAFLENHRHEGHCCLILDVELPGIDGLTLQERMAHDGSATPIIFITGHGDIPMSVRAIKAGADDFLSKPFDGDTLLAAVQAAIKRDARQSATRANRAALAVSYASLTARESEVFPLLITGMLNKQIGAELGITERTIKVHRASILGKFGVVSIAELVRIAARLGIAAANVKP